MPHGIVDIGLRKIIAFEQEASSVGASTGVSEAIPEIQSGGMAASPVFLERAKRDACHAFSDRNDAHGGLVHQFAQHVLRVIGSDLARFMRRAQVS